MRSGEQTGGTTSTRLHDLYQVANRLSFGLLDIFRFAIRRFTRVRGAEGAASIAFFTLFSLFPLLLVLVSIGGYVLESQDVRQQLLQFIRLTFPISSSVIIDNILAVLEERNTIGLLGLIGLAWSASGLLSAMITNLDRAWPTAKPRSFIEYRLVALGILAALSLLLAISTFANAILNLLFKLDLPWIPDEPFWNLVSAIFPFLLVFFVFLALYQLLPNTYVSWRAAFWAALVASIGWELTTNAFSWYLHSGMAQYNLVYGSLGAIVALLFWIYLIWLIIVFCAHLSAAIMHHRDQEDD